MFSLPQPFISQWAITDSVIDHYGHVNNVAYVAAWQSARMCCNIINRYI